jgi:hypothetical protein
MNSLKLKHQEFHEQSKTLVPPTQKQVGLAHVHELLISFLRISVLMFPCNRSTHATGDTGPHPSRGGNEPSNLT